jgi:hypothetical protein
MFRKREPHHRLQLRKSSHSPTRLRRKRKSRLEVI